MENVNELATALIEAQKEMGAAKKGSDNPFFKSKYADLASVIEAIKEPLLNNDICYVQMVEAEANQNFLITKLIHTSGQSLSGRMLIRPTKEDMQGLGSAITYARRYGLQAIVGLPAEDDDGNAASVVVKKPLAAPKPIVGDSEPIKPSEAIECSVCATVITEKVQKYSLDRYKKQLCFDCQKLEK